MRLRCSPFALIAVLLLGCSSSTPKPAEEPGEGSEATSPAQTSAPAAGDKGDDAAATAPPPMLKNGPVKDDSIADDYELTPGDCDALGKQYGRLARGDQMAALNPKLSAAQREQAETNIDRAIAPLETRWIDGCASSLAGKATERKLLKCAMDAKTVKAFDVCLNGEGGSAAEPKGAPAGKKKK